MVKGSMGSQEEEEEIDIVNKDGLLIYSNHNREGILKENLPEWESIKIDQQEKIFGSGKQHRHPGEKETTLYVFCRERGYLDFKGNGWTIISHIPTRVIFGPVNKLLKRLIIMFLVMLPGLALVIYLFSKTVSRPLVRLSFAAAEIGKGKLDTVIEVKSKDEIGSLANTFNEMAADLKKTTTSIDDLNKEITERKKVEEALRDSEAGFRAIFDNANDGILLADEETKKFYTGNNTACQMLGYSLEEIKNLGVPDIHPKEDLPYVIEQFEKQVRREIAVAKDLPVKRKDGTVFYADVNTSSLTLAGRKYLLGIFRDVTEHKRAEEEREKLIHELQDALGKIKTLSGMLPICASCKKIRDDEGYWNQIEAYIGDHSEAEFTHSICPECMKKLYPDFADEEK
jgi:PAS domain S-box-containing protein